MSGLAAYKQIFSTEDDSVPIDYLILITKDRFNGTDGIAVHTISGDWVL
jgi:hypothetical protein